MTSGTRELKPLRVAVLTVSDTRTEETDKSGALLAERLRTARDAPDLLGAKKEAELLIDLAPHLEDFLAKLFGIEGDVRALEARHHAASTPAGRRVGVVPVVDPRGAAAFVVRATF